MLNRTIVSTDDIEIADVAKKYGGDVPFIRPKDLSLDETPMVPVLKHAVSFIEKNENAHVDVVVLLDPTSPFRRIEDIENCIKKLKNDNTDSAVTVCEVEHNPYFVMMELDGNKLVPLIKCDKVITRRQDAPKVYRLNAAVYAIKRDVLMNENKIITKNTEAVIMPEELSAHIDHEMDILFAEFLLKREGSF
jgi:CMP-N-acetylneuraminic acid synthetase